MIFASYSWARRLHIVRFLVADGVWALFGCSIFFFLGYGLGSQFQELIQNLEDRINPYKPIVFLTIIGGIASVADLRKERFHSTAQRFRFQTLVQRYNTMQQYWSRICREIELGTFRRHRLKAEAVMASPNPARARAAETAAAASEGVRLAATPADGVSQGDVALYEPPPEDFPPVELGTGAGLASPLPASSS